MGQILAKRLAGAENDNENAFRFTNANNRRQRVLDRISKNKNKSFQDQLPVSNFVDLNLLPPELGIQILRNLNATDLCLASCVWSNLASDESLWEGLCIASWGFCSAYGTWKKQGKSFKKLFMILDEGSLTFNSQPEWGIKYLIDHHVLDDNVRDIARFFHCTNQLYWQKVRIYLREREDILEEVIKLQNFKNQFLPNALRKFFHAVDSQTSRGNYLNHLLEKFALRFCGDNPDLRLSPDVVTIICYSLILLSVDLTSPHVKNKMSKREFIRNVCRAVQRDNQVQPQQNQAEQNFIDRDYVGHLYDNIYLVGHVAPERWNSSEHNINRQ